MDLSIIIVTWNTRDLLMRCLASVYACPPDGAFEVLVVDNASADGTAAMVRERFSQVHLIESAENLGFARANNQAIRESSGRFLLLLNPDTEVQPGALETLVRFMEGDPQAGAAGARLLSPNGTPQLACHPAPTLGRELWRLLHLDTVWPYAHYPVASWDLDTPHQVDVVPGTCLILRREALDQVGLLDEGYFIYSEDVDLCYRLRRGGWGVYWVPQATVVHHGAQSTQQVAAEMFLRLYQGKIRYFRTHHGPWAARAYKGILLLTALARLLASPLAWLERPAWRQQHLGLAGNYARLVMRLPSM